MTITKPLEGNGRKPGNFRLSQLTLNVLREAVNAYGLSQGRWIDLCVQSFLRQAIENELKRRLSADTRILDLLKEANSNTEAGGGGAILDAASVVQEVEQARSAAARRPSKRRK